MVARSGSPRHRVVGILCMLVLLTTLAACGESNTTTTPTPTPTSSTLKMIALPLGIPAKALDAPVTGTVPDSQILHIGVSFKLNQALLDQMGKDKVGDTTGTVNAADLANKLGITDAQFGQIKQFFGIQGATVKLGKLHTSMTIDVKAGTVAALLHTRFVTHTLDGRSFYTIDPKMPPQVPAAIVGYIIAVTGLDNYSLPPKHGTSAIVQRSHTSSTTTRAQADCTADAQLLDPNSVGTAYGYNQFWSNGYKGNGRTINLVEIDGFDDADVQNYFSCVGYQGKLTVTSMGGSRLDPGAESTLDIDMIAGLASQVSIHDYEVDMTSATTGGADAWSLLNDTFQQLINDNANNIHSANAVSVSLGGTEGGITADDVAALDQSFKVLTQVEHMTVLVSSGDCGAFADETYNDLSVSYPASDPYNVAVGGTVLSVDANGNRAREVSWSDGTDKRHCQNAWGTGGGLSTLFSKPSWQLATGADNQYSNGKRQVPDISAVAYDLPVYYQGQWVGVGGTSAATPIWATGVVLLNQALLKNKQKFTYGPSLFYYVADNAGSNTPYRDITQGNNLYYQASRGWDYTTGLGTPNLVDFYNVVAKAIG